jgi:hypothetical protein
MDLEELEKEVKRLEDIQGVILVRSGPGRPTSINFLNGIASPMGNRKRLGPCYKTGTMAPM